ncbi:alpha/beta hydrolase [Variovorax defluvii]|uniref:Alpha/beta hydrolase n=1 Tax=Variovorax defluvii TaxID=913761 RepID=A0ABP8IDH0_9BURK
MKSFKLIGRGPNKVILFPGLLGTRDAFDEMLAYADLDRFQYAVGEYRGYGESRGEPGLYTLREVVVDAVRLVDYLGWPTFAAAGHSLGGLAAQMLAIALPQRVCAIVLIAGLAASGASRDPGRRQWLQELADSRQRREELVALGAGGLCAPAMARAVVDRSWGRIDGRALVSYAADAAQTDVHEQVRELPAPLLAIVGEKDSNCSAAAARETTLAWYRQATLEVLPGVGHYPPLEAPVATVALLERHVAAATG